MEQVYKDAATLARLRSGPFGTYLDEFIEQLRIDGYPVPTIHFHVRCVVGYGKWLRKNRKSQ